MMPAGFCVSGGEQTRAPHCAIATVEETLPAFAIGAARMGSCVRAEAACAEDVRGAPREDTGLEVDSPTRAADHIGEGTAGAARGATIVGGPRLFVTPNAAAAALEDLKLPSAAFGTLGREVRLRTNHFQLTVHEGLAAMEWLAWEVKFPLTEPPVGPAGKCFGKGGVGRAGREPPRWLRRAAIKALMGDGGLCDKSWVFDGYHRLYTAKGVGAQMPTGRELVSVPGGQWPVTVELEQAWASGSNRQQELDLRRLKLGRDAAEELRFVNVVMREGASEREGIVSVGRRVICPQVSRDLALSMERALQHGRELWMGYLSQASFVDCGDGKVTCTLGLNMVATVGLPRMPAMDLLAALLGERYPGYDKAANKQWYLQAFRSGRLPNKFDDPTLRILNSELGLKHLKVSCDYFNHVRKFTVLGISDRPADRLQFEHADGWMTVAKYFAEYKKRKLECPGLPCLELGKRGNWVPLELVTVLGGEHNLEVGKLRPDYQKAVTTRTTMPPGQRRHVIEGLLASFEVGPRPALEAKGLTVSVEMQPVRGRVLPPPELLHGGAAPIWPNGYANVVRAVAPPEFTVQWGIWAFARVGESELKKLAQQFVQVGAARGVTFGQPLFVEPRHDLSAEVLRSDLRTCMEKYVLMKNAKAKLHLLIVLLEGQGGAYAKLRSTLKTFSELEQGGFATQCENCEPSLFKGTVVSHVEVATKKLNNLMLKIVPKLPRVCGASGNGAIGAHNVRLKAPHPLLAQRSVVVFGGDVTHGVGGVSVAGIVATCDSSYANYFGEIRAQSPHVLNAGAQRRRQSEERILELDGMAEAVLRRWQAANRGELPEVVLYYRDGVSDGQLLPVLGREKAALLESFRRLSDGHGKPYNPKLAVIVGQKRHPTRLFRDEAVGGGADGKGSGKGSGKGGSKGDKGGVKGDKGCGKGDKGGKGGKDGKGGSGGGGDENIEAGTVASEGVAVPGYLNFFLAAQRGIKGTTVPCHYHVLHLDELSPGLSGRFGVDDIERITYDLCHLYSRADKTVSYASPAYLADHLCERGKLYYMDMYGEQDDLASSVSSGVAPEEEARERMRINTRVREFNVRLAGAPVLQGTNYWC